MNTRRIFGIALASTVLVLCACEDKNTPPKNTDTTRQPDNTGRNKNDRDTKAKTPVDQSNTSADVKITAEIRKAIMDDKSMSTNAQNCKIITESGVVTLRGPVESQTEKDLIESRAKAVAGVTRVVNELEVKTK